MQNTIFLGGPMIQQPEGSQWIQQGVLHGGIQECRGSSIFNLLTASSNLEWIQKNAEGLVGKCFVLWNSCKTTRFFKNSLRTGQNEIPVYINARIKITSKTVNL